MPSLNATAIVAPSHHHAVSRWGKLAPAIKTSFCPNTSPTPAAERWVHGTMALYKTAAIVMMRPLHSEHRSCQGNSSRAASPYNNKHLGTAPPSRGRCAPQQATPTLRACGHAHPCRHLCASRKGPERYVAPQPARKGGCCSSSTPTITQCIYVSICNGTADHTGRVRSQSGLACGLYCW